MCWIVCAKLFLLKRKDEIILKLQKMKLKYPGKNSNQTHSTLCYTIDSLYFTLQIALTRFIHWRRGLPHKTPNCPSVELTIHTLMAHSHQEQYGVKYPGIHQHVDWRSRRLKCWFSDSWVTRCTSWVTVTCCFSREVKRENRQCRLYVQKERAGG